MHAYQRVRDLAMLIRKIKHLFKHDLDERFTDRALYNTRKLVWFKYNEEKYDMMRKRRKKSPTFANRSPLLPLGKSGCSSGGQNN